MAYALAGNLRDVGFRVVGPAPDLAAANRLLADNKIDVACLDVRLGEGETSVPLAHSLAALGIPFMFLTAYPVAFLPIDMRDHPKLDKPFEPEVLVGRLARTASKRRHHDNIRNSDGGSRRPVGLHAPQRGAPGGTSAFSRRRDASIKVHPHRPRTVPDAFMQVEVRQRIASLGGADLVREAERAGFLVGLVAVEQQAGAQAVDRLPEILGRVLDLGLTRSVTPWRHVEQDGKARSGRRSRRMASSRLAIWSAKLSVSA